VISNRRAIAGWCMYDWANSAFAVVVLTAFFPMLFKIFWDSGAHPSLNTARLGMGETVAGLCVALLSPVLGAMADAGKARKAFLVFFMVLGTVVTGGICFVGPGAWTAAILLFVLANIGFACGNLFYDSMILDVAEKKDLDFVSSLGYASGYMGGGLLFLCDVVCLLFWQKLGFTSQIQVMRAAFVSVAAWWFVFSMPLLFLVKEQRDSSAHRPLAVIANGLARLKTTFLKIAADRLLILFIVAFWLYMDGVYTVITMAVNFGLSIGIQPKTLMMTILLVQFVAFPAAIGFGYLAGAIGPGKSILIGIGIYLAVCAIGFFVLQTSTQYMILACFVAIAQGGVQALSRSYFARIIPSEDSAEYFGFLNLIGKFSIVLGPALVGGATLLFHTAGMSDAFSSRLGMSSITVVFLAGGVLLVLAEKERLRRMVIR
jgi:UMF1 family MFS transporter